MPNRSSEGSPKCTLICAKNMGTRQRIETTQRPPPGRSPHPTPARTLFSQSDLSKCTQKSQAIAQDIAPVVTKRSVNKRDHQSHATCQQGPRKLKISANVDPETTRNSSFGPKNHRTSVIMHPKITSNLARYAQKTHPSGDASPECDSGCSDRFRTLLRPPPWRFATHTTSRPYHHNRGGRPLENGEVARREKPP
jgi:hypothetical protein